MGDSGIRCRAVAPRGAIVPNVVSLKFATESRRKLKLKSRIRQRLSPSGARRGYARFGRARATSSRVRATERRGAALCFATSAKNALTLLITGASFERPWSSRYLADGIPASSRRTRAAR